MSAGSESKYERAFGSEANSSAVELYSIKSSPFLFVMVAVMQSLFAKLSVVSGRLVARRSDVASLMRLAMRVTKLRKIILRSHSIA